MTWKRKWYVPRKTTSWLYALHEMPFIIVCICCLEVFVHAKSSTSSFVGHNGNHPQMEYKMRLTSILSLLLYLVVLFVSLSSIRFHPSCMGMTIEQAKKLEHFLCSDCTSEDDAKRSLNSFPVSPISEPKVRMIFWIWSFVIFKIIFYFILQWFSMLSTWAFYSDMLGRISWHVFVIVEMQPDTFTPFFGYSFGCVLLLMI